MSESDEPATHDREIDVACVRAVRVGHGGNCSSVGSVIDTLFLGAAAGGAIFAAICAAMKNEPIVVVGPQMPPRESVDAEKHDGP